MTTPAIQLRPCYFCGTDPNTVPYIGIDEWWRCVPCDLSFCSECLVTWRRKQWAAGEASTICCPECGATLLTAVD